VTDINADRGIADDPDELGQKQYLEVITGLLLALHAAFFMGTRDRESWLPRNGEYTRNKCREPAVIVDMQYGMQLDGHMATGAFGNLIQSETALQPRRANNGNKCEK